MSFAEAKIREYRISPEPKRWQLAEAYFAGTRPSELHIATVSKDRRLTETRDISEEEIARLLAEEGLLRVPPANQQLAGEFKRINVGGKPVSEMIIEERR